MIENPRIPVLEGLINKVKEARKELATLTAKIAKIKGERDADQQTR